MLERGRIGESWRSQRWDSFRMNTPNILTAMPDGLRPGLDPEGFVTSREFVGLLEDFAVYQGLQVETDTPVLELARDNERGSASNKRRISRRFCFVNAARFPWLIRG